MSPNEEQARNRFIIINITRIGATAIAILGLIVWQTDWPKPGGTPLLGVPLALIGLVASFAGAQWLVKKWRTPPE